MSVKHKCKFQEGWVSGERFQSWLQKLDSEPHDAFCKFCQKRFSIAGQGVKQIKSHLKVEKQTKRPPTSANNNKQQILMFAPSKDTVEELSSAVVCSSLAVEESSKHQQTLNSSLLNTDTSRAGIMWALEVLLNRYSYHLCMNKSPFFGAMFKGSKIAQNFKLGKTKCYYVICHGLALCLQESLVEQILNARFIVTMFNYLTTRQ